MNMRVYFPGGKKVDAEYNGFVIKTDQSKVGGGEGTAPEPFSLFMASLGTCAGIYVLGFCNQRGIATRGIEIIQSMEFDPIKRMIAKINMEIKLPEDFPEKYRAAVINSANLCAVKKHLQDPPEFNIFTSK
jgi:ribosomal protein S12 methylthiotransferase accessory factor